MANKDLAQLKREETLARNQKAIFEIHEKVLQEVGTVKSLADEVRSQMKRIVALPKGDKGDPGKPGRDARGLPGKDGYTPRKGVDYFDGYTPIKGKDYFTKADTESLTVSILQRIRLPKDGETPVVDYELAAEKTVKLIKEKQLLDTDSIKGLKNEISSYRNQLAMKQAGQHGGGDTVTAGTGITITTNSDGIKVISATGGGVGTVTSVSVVSANGFAGTVATSTTTPAITLTTTITGLLKGNGTAISAAVANTDYQVPITLTTTGSSGAATFDGTTLNIPQYSAGGGGTVDTVVGTADRITVNSTDPANPVVDIASTYVGQTSITTLGTIATGTWNATAIALNKITAITADRAVVSDGSGFISAATTTATEIGYVNGVTSSIQTQLNGKAAALSGTNNEIAYFNSSTTIASLTTATYPSLTELSYVKGVTSAIQTQLNGKQATGNYITALTGDVTASGPGSVAATLATVNANVGAFGSATAVGTFTVNAKGLITAAADVTVTPAVGSITGLGTGVATALAVNVGSAGAFVTFNGALGTPSSGTVTNLTGTASININGTVGATTPTTGSFTTVTVASDIIHAGDTDTTIAFTADAITITAGGVAAITITEAGTDTLAFGNYIATFAGASVSPSANDGSALGTTALGWSDAHFATGGTLNWANGNAVITHSSGILTVSTGDFRVTTAGTNAASVVTNAGTQTLSNKTIQHTVEPASDDTFTGETILGFNATATIAQWEAVYLSTTGWALTDADAAATAGGVMVGLATTSGTNGNPLTVVVSGVIRNDGWTWSTVGAPLYLSGTPGAITQTAPTGTDDVVRIIGYVLSDDCIYLNPSSDWITVV